ncbi:MAG: DNA-directed RNA polymerase subunit beta', partial [Holophagae bacterium]|nr:DNA-directed RNA polymerase subunit beta' [Holophagae bacterium]
VTVEEGEEISAGRTLAKIPRDTTKTMDITGGLPRVVDLFEGRKPKEQSIISEIDGVVSYGKIVRGNRKIFVTSDTGDVREYSIPKGKYIHFNKGDEIRSGEPLIDGPVSPHDILDVLGAKELQKFLINEVQEVYKMQGVSINDKHIEIIIRQMMRWIEVEDAGDSEYVIGDKVDKFEFMGVNDKLLEQGLEAARGKQLLLGITKAALNTRSFISAASFQETTRVLTEAAVQGKVDHLHGLKENVILGKLIPTGTGFPDYHDFKLERDETIPQEDPARFEIERASRSLGIEEKKPVDKE